MIISRTPYRISLFGGGTDYPAWFTQHGGEVVAASINRYCYLTCRYLPPFFERRFRIVYSVTEEHNEISDIRHPVVRAALQSFEMQHGLELHHDGDLPARSGIGSSSSFTVGILHALNALKGKMVSKHELAKGAIYLERDMLKENVGCQDQITAAYGGFNHIEFLRSGEFRVQPLTLAAHRIEEVASNLMLFYTGIRRISSDVAATYATDLESRSAQLQRTQQSVGQAKQLLMQKGQLKELGELLHETWLQKRALSKAVSRPEIDEMYAEARAAGAVGGKILGAGGGGFLLLVVPPEQRAAVRQRLQKLIQVPFAFEQSGSQIIYYEPEEVEDPV
jgi:D-glycero-alpha-D-manno-heptose-7-phosphate kinase